MHSEQIEQMIRNLKTVKEADTLAGNALVKGREDVARAALARKYEIEAGERGPLSTIEQEAWRAFYALRDVAPNFPGRTYQSLKNAGNVTDVIAKIVKAATPSKGFERLIENGMQSHLFEAIVIRHPDAFDAKTIEAARARLATIEQASTR